MFYKPVDQVAEQSQSSTEIYFARTLLELYIIYKVHSPPTL